MAHPQVGERPLVALIRIRDQLEIGDDEDLRELRAGDELQATFAERACVALVMWEGPYLGGFRLEI